MRMARPDTLMRLVAQAAGASPSTVSMSSALAELLPNDWAMIRLGCSLRDVGAADDAGMLSQLPRSVLTIGDLHNWLTALAIDSGLDD